MRVTSDLWVSALCKRARSEGAFAYVTRKGAKEAGAIFIVVNELGNSAGAFSLYTPALQSQYVDDTLSDRLFERRLENAEESAIIEQIERETRFDSDIWVIEIEDRENRTFWQVAED